MDLWAIIPVKPFTLGKSRLAGVLSDSERAEFNRRLFDHVFEVARGELGPDRVIVASTDTKLLAQIVRFGAHAMLEPEPSDLNFALGLASQHATELGAGAIVVLPGDLPDLNGKDIAAMNSALGPAPSCAIAPDASEQGTNALALTPPADDFFRFGTQSFAAHLRLAEARGYATQIVRRPGLAQDIDTPESYRQFASRTRNATLRHGGRPAVS